MKMIKHLNFKSLVKVARKVFDTIPEFRHLKKIKISITDTLTSGLACMFFQNPSLLSFQRSLQKRCKSNNLKTLFEVERIPKDYQLREITDNIDSAYFAPIFKKYYQFLQRLKYLDKFQIFPRMYYVPIDGSMFFLSKEVHCKQCLTKKHKNGEITFEHYVLQGGIMHPDMKTVIPFMPEQISNKDGTEKQDCEMNAAKRFLKKLKDQFPRLKMLVGGDALFSKQPLIEDALKYGMNYLFVAKPQDHVHMMKKLTEHGELNQITFKDDEGSIHCYEWMNCVELNGNKETIKTNFLRCNITYRKRRVKDKIKQPAAYINSWVTNIEVSESNIKTLVRAGRCKWKGENEVFNVLKNHGYNMEHNYGHGKKHLAFNFYIQTVLAFFMHQILEMTDGLYQQCKASFANKKIMWSALNTNIIYMVFDTWETLLQFALDPPEIRISANGISLV